MRTHHRGKGSELNPAYVEFAISVVLQRLLTAIIPKEEAPDIGIPIRNTTRRKIKRRRNLFLKGLPASNNIARPCFEKEKTSTKVEAFSESQTSLFLIAL